MPVSKTFFPRGSGEERTIRQPRTRVPYLLIVSVRTHIAAAVLVVIAMAAPPQGWGQVSGSIGGPGGGNASASPLVTPGELGRHATWLSSDALAGRRAGTVGAERAARYVVEAFQAAGLEAPSDHPTYLQTFDFAIGVELGRDNLLVLQRGDRRTTVFEPGRDFVPLAGSLADRFVLPAMFVGYGISAPALGYDDYADIDVRGKIVLVLRYSPEGDEPGGRFGPYLSERYKAITAREHGARAILFVNGPATEEIDRLIPFRIDEQPNRMGIVAMSVTQAVGRRIVAIGGGDLTVWQREIDESGEPSSRVISTAIINLRADLRPRTRTTHNVIGVVPGRDSDLADEAVVIGAHYDGLGLGGAGSLDPVPGAIHNGADDNASGVAALIELAQFFSYPTNRPRRSLVFVAFGAEEEGMLGSAHFVTEPSVPLERIVAMINLDMIGRLDDELIVYGVGSSAGWSDLIERANGEVGLSLKLMSEGYGPSDHAAFYLRQIPVLALFTGVHEDYHRASDDVDELNIPGLEKITRLTMSLVEVLSERGGRLAFDPREFEPRTIAAAPETPAKPVRLGAIPAPMVGVDAVVIEQVVEGSIAERAGVEIGDLVVRIGRRNVTTIYDYIDGLRDIAALREVRLIVERNGERRTLMLDLAAGGGT